MSSLGNLYVEGYLTLFNFLHCPCLSLSNFFGDPRFFKFPATAYLFASDFGLLKILDVVKTS